HGPEPNESHVHVRAPQFCISHTGAPRRSFAFLSWKPASLGTRPVFSYAILSSGAGNANAPFTCSHVRGFVISLPSTMLFDVSSSAAASPSVGQHQPRLNSTSSSTTFAPSSGGSSQYLRASSDTLPGSSFDSFATASC